MIRIENHLSHVVTLRNGRKFIYDGLTGRIHIPEIDAESDSVLITKMVDSGALTPGYFSGVKWYQDFEEYYRSLESNMDSLVLQITRRCNLACEYCVYSGRFYDRLPHADEDMPLEIIKKSIDFFLEHSQERSKIYINFYGGEALLCEENVKEAIRYTKERVAGKDVFFEISSNGLCVNDEECNWLFNNPEVQVNITLNGPYQDVFRKTSGGNGSLKTIKNNIDYIKRNYPQVWKNQIQFTVNVVSDYELPDIRSFYHVLGKLPCLITKISTRGADDMIRKKIEDKRKECKYDMLQEYIEQDDDFLFLYYGREIVRIHDRHIAKNDITYVHSCLPLSNRLFIRTDGTINICEKVTDHIALGDVFHGLDKEMIRYLYNSMLEIVDHNCRNCWAQRLCSFCYQDAFDKKGKILNKIPEEFCKNVRCHYDKLLRAYCEIGVRDRRRLKKYDAVIAALSGET